MVAEHISVEIFFSCSFNPVDPVLGIPVAFLVGYNKASIRVQANPVGCPESRCEDIRTAAVFLHSEQGSMMGHHCGKSMARRLRVVKVPLIVGLETHREFMEMLRNLMVIVENLNVVRFSVSIFIVKKSDHVPAPDIDLSFHYS